MAPKPLGQSLQATASRDETQSYTVPEGSAPNAHLPLDPTTIHPTPPLTADHLPSWQTHLTTLQPSILLWPLTRLVLPGTHDSATYGPGCFPTNLARFNWRCQSHDIYSQCLLGIRYFDLRLERESLHSSSSDFWPFHGAAKRTGDKFADTEEHRTGTGTTIVNQLLRFLGDNPGEILVLHVTVKDASIWGKADGRGTVWEIIMEQFGEAGAGGKCVPSPDSGTPCGRVPAIAEAREKGWNFVFLADVKHGEDDGSDAEDEHDLEANDPLDPTVATFVRDYVWKVPGKGALKGPYTSKTWKSNKPEAVRLAIENWMGKNERALVDFTHFWTAQCQLTPSMNNVFDLIQSVWNPMITTSPKRLATIMNPYVRDVILKEALWKRRVNIVQLDFPGPVDVLDIVRMNMHDMRLA